MITVLSASGDVVDELNRAEVVLVLESEVVPADGIVTIESQIIELILEEDYIV
jgi:hypothetical protein